MNFEEMKEVSFSKSDIGHSKLLHTPVEAYKYHDTEMYLVPLTMENYEDPLFKAVFPVIGTVVDFAVDVTDKENESLKKDLGKLKIVSEGSGIRTDGKDFYVRHWHMIIKISYVVITNPYAIDEWYRTFTHHPEFEKEFTEVVKPTKTIKPLYDMIYNWTRMELIIQRVKCQKIMGNVTTLENRLLQLDLIK
jgi:hypothetical protein